MTGMTNAKASCHYRVQLQILPPPIYSTTDEPEIVIEGALHFLQEEKGEGLAGNVVNFTKRRPSND